MNRQSNLFQVVDALGTSCRVAGRLNRWQEQGDKKSDDTDHDQQLDQRESGPGPRRGTKSTMSWTRSGGQPQSCFTEHGDLDVR
jgi:hypothetical protein